jgi:hypothetical protein
MGQTRTCCRIESVLLSEREELFAMPAPLGLHVRDQALAFTAGIDFYLLFGSIEGAGTIPLNTCIAFFYTCFFQFL